MACVPVDRSSRDARTEMTNRLSRKPALLWLDAWCIHHLVQTRRTLSAELNGESLTCGSTDYERNQCVGLILSQNICDLDFPSPGRQNPSVHILSDTCRLNSHQYFTMCPDSCFRIIERGFHSLSDGKPYSCMIKLPDQLSGFN